MIKQITSKELKQLAENAVSSGRKRSNWNLHPTLGDTVQRFFNAIEPGSYVCPHRHEGEDRWELFLAVQGSAMVLTFDTDGRIAEKVIVAPQGEVTGVEIPGNTWHTLLALEPSTILYETKQGPYQATSDKGFAPWAPREGHPACASFLEWYIHGQTGSNPPQITL